MGAFLRWVGTAFGVLVMIGVVFGFLMDAGVVPSDRVLSGSDIPQDQFEVLLSEGIVEQGEVIELFYSEGLISVREGGSLLTDRRVIAYEEGFIYEVRNEDISSVEMTQQGDSLNYSVYTVMGEDEENWVDLWLPHEYGDGERFANAVKAKIR